MTTEDDILFLTYHANEKVISIILTEYMRIYANCMNDAVGDAFFSFLHSVDLTGYRDQDFPITKAKEDAIVKRLDSVASYIKDKYILKYKILIRI